jgi:hypothetical protein
VLRACARGHKGISWQRIWDPGVEGARPTAVELALSGGRVALLLDNGTVAHGTSVGVGDRHVEFRWEPRWEDGPYVELCSADARSTLVATRRDGTSRTAPASAAF